MTSQYLRQHGTRKTAQNKPMREDQIENQAGGFVFSVGAWEQLRRWLILGSDGGSYYASEQKQTLENVNALRQCLKMDGVRAVAEIRDISVSGRAPKNELAIFALAYAAGTGNDATRAAALKVIPEVCRTGTHLFQFVEYVQQHRGWGPALMRAVGDWYIKPREEETITEVEDPIDPMTDTIPVSNKAEIEARHINWLAYQLVKYRQRGGWTHRDVLRKAKPKPERGSAIDELLGWTVGRFSTDTDPALVPPIIFGFEWAQKAGVDIARLLKEYPELPREALPNDALTSPNVWEALLDNDMPMTALIRNLANMTRAGLLTPTSSATQKVIAQLGDTERIRKARVHPISVLMAQMTYASGRGVRGGNTWSPIPVIVDALDEAFYKAFANVQPTGKRYLLALDISGSMDQHFVAGVPGLTPRMASSAMAMVTAQTESLYECVGFYAGATGWKSPFKSRWAGSGYANVTEDGLTPIALSKRQRLDDVVQSTNRLPMGGTDCALPMLYALDQGREFDVFVVFTDNETWAGNMHPAQALKKYREQSGIDAKMIVVGMVANNFSIADPEDPGMLDVVGFDASAPAIMSEFALGNV